MKKIGIFTFHRAHNYGALLQAYALQKFLKNSYEVCFIDYYNTSVYNNYKVFKPLGRNVFKWPSRFYNNIVNYKVNFKKNQVFNNFIKTNFVLCKNSKKTYENLNVLITGSDQVWNPHITGGLTDEYTLNVGDSNLKRISYAASVGNINIVKENKNLYLKKIEKIDYISVRELDLKNILSSYIDGKDIANVLDPTFLLTSDEWEKIIGVKEKKQEKYILAYVVKPNDEYVKIVNELSKITGLKVICFDNGTYENVLERSYFADPFDFINLIKNAQYVVTTSFHATVFSVIFNKNFWVVPHSATGSRVTELLKKLNLSDRVVTDLSTFKNKDIKQSINYQNTNSSIDIERKKSQEWLLNAIEK